MAQQLAHTKCYVCLLLSLLLPVTGPWPFLDENLVSKKMPTRTKWLIWAVLFAQQESPVYLVQKNGGREL